MSADFAAEPERERFSPHENLSMRDRPLGAVASVGVHALLIALIPLLAVSRAKFFAGKVLAEEKRIAAALPTLGNDERVIQLCNIEALEQIKAAKPEFAPDTLVAYAFGDMNLVAGILTAPGGAFRSRRRWWNVSLKCAVAADFSAVTAFEFTLGDEVPSDAWDAHDLTDEDAEE